MASSQEPVPTNPAGLRGWLKSPLYVRNAALIGFASCLILLASKPIPFGSKLPICLAAISLGIYSASALVYSPESSELRSGVIAFFLAFVLHGLIIYAAILGRYNARMLVSTYLGGAINVALRFVMFEWVSIMVLGHFLVVQKRRPRFRER